MAIFAAPVDASGMLMAFLSSDPSGHAHSKQCSRSGWVDVCGWELLCCLPGVLACWHAPVRACAAGACVRGGEAPGLPGGVTLP